MLRRMTNPTHGESHPPAQTPRPNFRSGIASALRNEGALLLLVAVAILSLTGGCHAMEHLGGIGVAMQFALLLSAILWGAFRVVHHAEDIAHILGEPLGTLVLTLAVIGIEVALVVAVMLGGQAEPTAARDTMFSVLMLSLNLVLGLALLVGGYARGQSRHNLQGSTSYVGTLIVLGGLSLVWPRISESAPDGRASVLQEWFLVGASVACYVVFLVMQTGRTRGWFQDVEEQDTDSSHGAAPKSLRSAVPLLLVYLGLIILLAEQMAHSLENVVVDVGLPKAIAGLVIASIILAPEAMATLNAAKQGSMQRAVNLSLGAALSTIGLTVPAVLAVSLATGQPVELGLEPTEILLLALTYMLSINTMSTGRTTHLHGLLHVALFCAYVVLIFDV
jgi:Ca2+:H+ antiporter